jgi:AsmA protein
VSVSVFPSGSVSFSDVTLSGDRNHPALTAERLTTHVRFLPLLLGRIEVADVALVRPRILVNLDSGGHTNWSALLDTLARTLAPGAAASGRVMSFSEIRLTGGTLLINDESSGVVETLDAVELSLAWPSISRSFGATGQFVWRGEKVDASVSLGDFLAALTGDRSGLKVRMASPLMKAAFDGHVSHRPTLRVEGTLAADSLSLRSALRWAGQKPLPGGGLGRFALKAQTSVVGTTIALSSVNVELDGNSAEGVLTFAGNTAGRPSLQGTLAADELDVSPYVSTVKLLGANERDWSRVPITLDALADFELDLRLSAARVTLNGRKMGRTAIATNLRNGRFAVAIGESQAFGGTLKGSISVAKADAGADIKTQLQFTDVDLEACLDAVLGTRRVEGRGNFVLAMEASGADMLGLTRTAAGAATLTATRGALSGINVEQLLRRLERRPLSGGEFRSGRTPFDSLAITLKLVDGKASLEDVRLDGPSVKLAIAGSTSIPTRDLDLKGIATLVGSPSATNTASAFELPFVVRGPWEDPIMLPDADSLIRRSGAAAPLLDAVRGGKARDAVRSAIEQLTRGAEKPKADTSAPTAAAQ